MGRETNRLTAIEVKNLTTPGLYPDGAGLHLQIAKGGSKSWIFRYSFAGRKRDLGLGSVKDVSLADARLEAAEARRLLANGIDPIEERRETRAQTRRNAARALTFKQAAENYIASNEPGWKNAKHLQQWKNTLKTYVYPVIGKLPVSEVTTEHVLKILLPIWTTKTETASRIRGRIETILNAAKTLGAREGENPALWRGHLSNLLPKQSKIARVKHHPAMPYTDVPDFFVKLIERPGSSALALRFLILTAVRTSEVLGARWKEIDMDAAVWTIPAERMKGDREHRVPLSPAALDVLREAAKFKLNDFVFPGQKPGRPLSNMALLMLLRRFGIINATGHGFRSTMDDWAHEETHHPTHVIDMALAHAIENKTEAAYRRGNLFEKRRALMNDWATYCTTPPEEKVVKIADRRLEQTRRAG